MPTESMKLYYVGGADFLILRGSVTLSPALIAQATCAEQTLTVPGSTTVGVPPGEISAPDPLAGDPVLPPDDASQGLKTMGA